MHYHDKVHEDKVDCSPGIHLWPKHLHRRAAVVCFQEIDPSCEPNLAVAVDDSRHDLPIHSRVVLVVDDGNGVADIQHCQYEWL